VTALRKAGAVILGKTNLSEWANFYAFQSINGYSTLGGHTRHPLGAFDVGGSSSGSCAAVRLGLIPVSVGSETTGSIVYPASQNGVVGLKPSIGLISRDRIIPITDAFDTAGPIGRTVTDVAVLMSALAARKDTNDKTTDTGRFGTDFTSNLSIDALQGVRVGLVARIESERDEDDMIRAEVVRRLTAAGAMVVDVPSMAMFVGAERDKAWGRESLEVMTIGFRLGVEAYLESQGERVPVKRMADIVSFNEADAPNRIPSGQELIIAAANATPDALAGYSLLSEGVVSAYAKAVREALSAHQVAVLADFANYASPYHSRSGFPAVTLPAGVRSSGEPLGITLFGDAFTDTQLLAYAFAFEAQA
jgi:amidase